MTKVLVIGGCGFVGSNLVSHFIDDGEDVTAFDDLSRPGGGSIRNLAMLTDLYEKTDRFHFIRGDVRSFDQVFRAVREADVIFNVAAQTALTTSIEEPMADFRVNAVGTLNILEAARIAGNDPTIICASSTAVYGDLTQRPVKVIEADKRYVVNTPEFRRGFDENWPIGRGGPYGCSKAAADLYCLEYAKSYGLKTVVFRMSATYGPWQNGTEDQGWVGWFLRRAMEHKPVTIFGDGKQVRDVLFVGDLVKAFECAARKIEVTAGNAYNIGGGPDRSLSILELLDLLKNWLGVSPSTVEFAPWRPVDCPVLILDTSKAAIDFDWEPFIGPKLGLRATYRWMIDKGVVV